VVEPAEVAPVAVEPVVVEPVLVEPVEVEAVVEVTAGAKVELTAEESRDLRLVVSEVEG